MQRPNRPRRLVGQMPLRDGPSPTAGSPYAGSRSIYYRINRNETRRVVFNRTRDGLLDGSGRVGRSVDDVDDLDLPGLDDEETGPQQPPRPDPPHPFLVLSPPSPPVRPRLTAAPSSSQSESSALALLPPSESTPSSRSCESAGSEVVKRLLSVLECPVCLEYATPPILQCREGHLVCSGCRARLSLCPKCRQPFTDIRARALEQVAEVVPYPCHNTGCDQLLLLSEKSAHEAACEHRQYPCTIEPCLWTGKKAQLAPHITNHHPGHLITSSTHEVSLTVSQHVNEEKTFMFDCFNELFHCVMGVDSQQEIFVGFVMLLGPREKASDYEFELKFMRDTPPFTTISIVQNVLEEAPPSSMGINGGINAVVVSFSTLRDVIQEDSGHPPVLPLFIAVRKRQHPTIILRVPDDSSPEDLPAN